MFSRLNRVLGDIFRKPMTTNLTILYNSNHHTENKLATNSLIINRQELQDEPVTSFRRNNKK
jgi:hypothetical protein